MDPSGHGVVPASLPLPPQGGLPYVPPAGYGPGPVGGHGLPVRPPPGSSGMGMAGLGSMQPVAAAVENGDGMAHMAHMLPEGLVGDLPGAAPGPGLGLGGTGTGAGGDAAGAVPGASSRGVQEEGGAAGLPAAGSSGQGQERWVFWGRQGPR